MKENLYGKLPLDEAKLIEFALIAQANIHKTELMCPDDAKKGFDRENPLRDLCDLGTAVLALIYGKQEVKAIKERYWFYANEQVFRENQNNYIGPHYDYVHPKYKRLDFTRCQFPLEYYLKLKSINHGITFNSLNRIPARMQVLLPGFMEYLRIGFGDIAKPTPEFVRFVNGR